MAAVRSIRTGSSRRPAGSGGLAHPTYLPTCPTCLPAYLAHLPYHECVRRAKLSLLLATLLSTSCTQPAPREAETIAVVRSIGTFSGRGSQTLGVVSESGYLRISWQTRHEEPAGTGTFRLALHSGVSGRPIELITDQRGEVHGTRDVTDDPRPYNLMVDSQNLDWTVTVEEIVSARVRP